MLLREISDQFKMLTYHAAMTSQVEQLGVAFRIDYPRLCEAFCDLLAGKDFTTEDMGQKTFDDGFCSRVAVAKTSL